jgi:hypothetical protein
MNPSVVQSQGVTPRCARTDTVSQFWMRVSTRADRIPALLAAAQARRRAPAHGFAQAPDTSFGERHTSRASSPARAPCAPSARRQGAGSMPAACRSTLPQGTFISCKAWGGPLWGCVGDGEERSLGVGACTHALRKLTHRVCSSATNAVSAASYTVRPQGEYRSEPAQRASHSQLHSGRPQALPAHHRASAAHMPA